MLEYIYWEIWNGRKKVTIRSSCNVVVYHSFPFQGQGEIVEIQEEYDEEKEKKWRGKFVMTCV